MFQILLHPDATTAAIRSGMLPVMLKILEDAVRKMNVAVPDSDEASVENLQAVNELMQEFVFGTAYGILMFLYCLLLQRSTVDKLQDFLQLFQLFAESHGGRLIEKTVVALLSLPHVEAKLSTSRTKKVMNFNKLGNLGTAKKFWHFHSIIRVNNRTFMNTKF
jgi:hypothetical protein